IASSALPLTDLSSYDAVIVASDQPTPTYIALANRASQLDDYVTGGGTLEFHAAGWGFNSGEASIVTLPGGVHIQQYSDYTDTVVLPDHPLVAGVPPTIQGTTASHSHLTDLPPDAEIVAT